MLRGGLKFWLIASAIALAVACSGKDDAAIPTPPAETTDAAAEPPDTSAPAPDATATVTPDASSDADAADAGPPLDVPASLVSALGGKTYVEDSCQPTTYPGWPYAAEKCTYRTNLVVTIANPTPDRVAHWIVDASTLIEALDGLHTRDRASWEAGLKVMATHTIGQSSRIFPLEGQVWENGTAYKFERGVTKTCSTGCYCRVNSTNRQQWCAYATDVLGIENEASCLSKYGLTTSTLTEAWMAHCLENHKNAWNADKNDHYRAQAWAANNALKAQFPNPQTAVGADVVAALEEQY